MPLRLAKRPLPLHVLDADDLALDFAHRWWHAHRRHGLLPPRAAVDTEMFRLLVDGAGWVDLRPAEAATWRLDALALPPCGADAGEAAAILDGLRGDFARIRFTGVPLLQDMAVGGGVCRLLALPHGEDGTRVDELLVLVRWRAVGQTVVQDDPSAASRR